MEHIKRRKLEQAGKTSSSVILSDSEQFREAGSEGESKACPERSRRNPENVSSNHTVTRRSHKTAPHTSATDSKAWLAKISCFVLACFLLLPALAQAAEPYFSVSTDRAFLPGEKATVHLYTRNVQALEFRLYRVNDPMLFFEKLGDVHGFGQRSPKEQIEEKTWVEKFHDWKRGRWRDVRNFFREQFSDRSRAAIRLAQGEARKNVSPATMFAQLPLLNDKQLVARWRQDVPPRYFSERQDVPIDKLDKGAYVVEATDGALRAYTVLLVTELAVVTKSAPGQMLAYAVDRRVGAPIPNTRIDLWASKKK